MKISEVMAITGLTKKAINYYEENELISPSVKINNNYRDYTEENIEKLKQISALRSFDIPVKKIKEILMNPKEIEKIFTEYLDKIKVQIANMERYQGILQLCINDVKCMRPNIKKLLIILLKKSFGKNYIPLKRYK